MNFILFKHLFWRFFALTATPLITVNSFEKWLIFWKKLMQKIWIIKRNLMKAQIMIYVNECCYFCYLVMFCTFSSNFLWMAKTMWMMWFYVNYRLSKWMMIKLHSFLTQSYCLINSLNFALFIQFWHAPFISAFECKFAKWKKN